MFARYYKPHPGLTDLITRVVVVHYRFDPLTVPPTNPFPPHPGQTLYFYPYERVTRIDPATGAADRIPQSIFVGPIVSSVDLRMAHNTLVIIILFRPGGMHRLLRIPMEELFGAPVESSLFEGRVIDHLLERLNQTKDYDLMNEIVQQYLLQKTLLLKAMLPVDQALNHILQTHQPVTVDHLASLACVSTRQLERQFRERVGISPKLYMKLARFSNAWVMRERDPQSSWLHIAHACGYADQMHLIRDFKLFTGQTPTALQRALDTSPLRLQGSSLPEERERCRI